MDRRAFGKLVAGGLAALIGRRAGVDAGTTRPAPAPPATPNGLDLSKSRLSEEAGVRLVERNLMSRHTLVLMESVSFVEPGDLVVMTVDGKVRAHRGAHAKSGYYGRALEFARPGENVTVRLADRDLLEMERSI